MLKQFIKFSTVGISGLLINLAVYSLLMYSGQDYLVAAGVAFLAAVSNNFYWNFLWTFKGQALHKSVRRKYGWFLVISGINFMINLALLTYLVQTRALDAILAQVIAIGVASTGNFLLNRLITFR